MEGEWFGYEPEKDHASYREYLIPYTEYIISRQDIPYYLTVKNNMIINMFLQYVTKNILPYEGGYWDQPAPITDVLNCLSDQLAARKKKQKGR
jgi:hypothetical protein